MFVRYFSKEIPVLNSKFIPTIYMAWMLKFLQQTSSMNRLKIKLFYGNIHNTYVQLCVKVHWLIPGVESLVYHHNRIQYMQLNSLELSTSINFLEKHIILNDLLIGCVPLQYQKFQRNKNQCSCCTWTLRQAVVMLRFLRHLYWFQ